MKKRKRISSPGQFTVRLGKLRRYRLNRQARRMGVSAGDFVRRMLDKVLDKLEGKSDGEQEEKITPKKRA